MIGAGIVCDGIGTLVSGAEGVLVYADALAYLVLLSVWGLLMGSYLSRLRDVVRVSAT